MSNQSLTSGWLIWRGHRVEWKYMTFKSKKDLTYQPHFIIRAIHKDGKSGDITFNNIQVTAPQLKATADFNKLPDHERFGILNMIIDTLEKGNKSGNQ